MLGENELKLYNHLVLKIHTSANLKELIFNVLSGLQQLVPYQNAAFFLINHQNSDFFEPLFFGIDYSGFTNYYDHNKAYGEITFPGGPVSNNNSSSKPMDYRLRERNEHESNGIPQDINRIACLQIFQESLLCGEISLHRNSTDPDFSANEMFILRLLDEQINARFSSLLMLKDDWPSLINIFKAPRQNLSLCFLDSRCKMLAATPSALELLPQGLITGETVYSHLKNACYCLEQEHAKPNPFASRNSSGLLHLKEGFYHYQIFLLQDKCLRDPLCYLLLLHNHSSNNDTLPGKWVLTKREAEIASLLTRGRTNKQIAGELGISENTIKTFVKRLFNKLGVHSRSELISEMYKLAPTADGSLEEWLTKGSRD